ncbi:MAG: hypothetical protein FH749_14400 [Firmicutes bacterium]|nr:hypothetical protein [Bacillota bacterium]
MKKFWPLLVLLIVLLLPANCLLRDRAFILNPGADIQSFNADGMEKQLTQRFEAEFDEIYIDIESLTLILSGEGKIREFATDFTVPVSGRYHQYRLQDKRVSLVDDNFQALEHFRLPVATLFSSLDQAPWSELLLALPEADGYWLKFERYLDNFEPQVFDADDSIATTYVDVNGSVIRVPLREVSLNGPTIIARCTPLDADGSTQAMAMPELLILRP